MADRRGRALPEGSCAHRERCHTGDRMPGSSGRRFFRRPAALEHPEGFSLRRSLTKLGLSQRLSFSNADSLPASQAGNWLRARTARHQVTKSAGDATQHVVAISRRGTRTGRRQHVNVPSYPAGEGRRVVLDFHGPPHDVKHVRLHLLPELLRRGRITAFRAIGQSLPLLIFEVHCDLPF